MISSRKYSRGSILLLSLVFMGIFFTVSTALIGYSVEFSRTGKYTAQSSAALILAEAGIEKAIYELNEDSSYTGESGVPLGEGEFSVTISSIDANTKLITATGYIPNSADPQATKVITAKTSIDSSIVAFNYGVQVGNGGVEMNNGSQINGNIYSNGNIFGSGTVTGDATIAGGTASTPDQQWVVQDIDQNLGNASANRYLAQSFIPSSSTVINKVSLYIKKTGSPSDLTVQIVTDNAGKPSNTVVASGSLPASSVGTSYAFVDGTLSTSPTLTGSQTYWLKITSSVNASHYFVWGADSTDAYTSGTAKSSANNSTWSNLSRDLDFKVWMGGVVTYLDGITVGGTAWAHELKNCTVGNATYQTITNCTVSGTQTVSATDASPAAMPISDTQIDAWETAALAGGVISGDYTLSGTETLGPRKIDGNLTINNNATLLLTGPLWVAGNIVVSNNALIKVDSSLGNNGTVLIADKPGSESTMGRVTLTNNTALEGNGNSGSNLMILSTYSGASTAINLENNGSSVILYAPSGLISVANNAGANQVTANQLLLNNNATITYVTGLQSSSFSSGPGGSWAFIPGSYTISN